MREFNLPANLSNMRRNALALGLLGLIVGAIGVGLSFIGIVPLEQFFQSYLFGYVFVLQFPLGCLGLLMVHHLAGGRWGFTIRRLLEAGAMTLPVMGLLFIPVLVGMDFLYEWLHEVEDPLIQHKAPYLNMPFFIIRAVLYFIIWSGLAYLFNQMSRRQDETGEGNVARFKALSAAGVILFMLTVTFAAYDWMMSLQPHWFSSIYGVIYIAGSAAATVALMIIMGRTLHHQEPMSEWFTLDIFNDLANFMLAFVSFWAYVSFSQYLIIWSANLPEEITWYIYRSQGGWQYQAMALIFLQFALPFLLLLSRAVKRNINITMPLAAWVIFMRAVDWHWHIMPAFYPEGFHFHWLDLALPLGLGGLWMWLFITQLRRKPLIAQHDPRFQEVPAHG